MLRHSRSGRSNLSHLPAEVQLGRCKPSTAHNSFVGIEHLTDEELEDIRKTAIADGVSYTPGPSPKRPWRLSRLERGELRRCQFRFLSIVAPSRAEATGVDDRADLACERAAVPPERRTRDPLCSHPQKLERGVAG